MEDKEDIVYFAKLAEQAERYEEMRDSMKKIAQLDVELTTEERNLLSVAYKNVIGSRRAAWRVVVASKQREEEKKGKCVSNNLELVTCYKQKVEDELRQICEDILELLKKNLIPNAGKEESQVFYYKMKGDYNRYLAEFQEQDKRKDAAENALLAYKVANDIACEKLDATNPIRLGLALNFSVFYYEILNSPARACQLAKDAFDRALVELEKNQMDEAYKDSTLIMQLLKDNLTLWTSDMQGDDDDDDEKDPIVQDVCDQDQDQEG